VVRAIVAPVTVIALFASFAKQAWTQPVAQALTFDQAIEMASRSAPEVAAAHARESVAKADIDVAGVYPNPQAFVGTSTQTARLSAGVSFPLVVFGQRGAAMGASHAEYEAVRVDSAVVLNEVRTGCAHAFVSLWLAQRVARERAEAAGIACKIEQVVLARVQEGAAPEVEALRGTAERLRADADAAQAEQLVEAAASELGRWLGAPGVSGLRAAGDPPTPQVTAPLPTLLARSSRNPTARREDSEAQAAEARADRERAWVRPALSLQLSFDSLDPTLPATDYHALLGVDVPLFNQRGAYVDRETRDAAAARARAVAARARISAELAVAYRQFAAAAARRLALEQAVVPAANKAALAVEDSYAMGRAPLVAVLDAERARIDVHTALVEARAAHAHAWVDIQKALGWP
jgi:outer membrane protein, heavy metal efflux system